METWFVIIVTICLATLLKAFLSLNSNSRSKSKSRWPPGPRGVPIISNILWLKKSSPEMEAALRSLHAKFGSIVTLPMGSRPVIFVSSRSLAHQALVQNGAVFADRPKPPATLKFTSSNQHSISSAGYGPTWRLLRRNLMAQILHPSRLKEFSNARKWVLDILLSRLRTSAASIDDPVVKVMDDFRFAMFCLLVFMCFGDKLDEPRIREIEDVQRRLLVSSTRFQVLNFWPWLTKIVLRSRWEELFDLRKKEEDVFIPLIRARNQNKHHNNNCYVDTLLTLELQEDQEKRKLSEAELVSACSEFLTAGTDTTSTALQWIMANLVKNPNIQAKLYEEIQGVIGPQAEEIKEDELSKMPYLKAVVLEGLRRHPPGHFVLPHAVTQEVELGGYVVPKNAIVNFMVAEMGWDPEVWEDPMTFKPERFLSNNEEFDITGSREIKMMPFGAGRRICPAYGLAMLHFEYFVANLVWNFEWASVDGKDVDLSEKQEFTIVMKHPLHAHISPRKIK